MRPVTLLICGLCLLAFPTNAGAQRMLQRERAFLREAPQVGEPLPNVAVYAPDGSAFRTEDLRGHYTVLTFGCLT